jgi:hypothetical protein
VVLDHGPEGSVGGCPGERPGGTISGAGVVSGIRSPDRAGYLIGVFLPDKITVGSPPENLDFTGNYDFLRLSPRLAQLFLIGDGRAGLRPQHFEIPAGATHLYLGIADAWGFRGSPGYYDDNTGAFNLTVRSGRKSPEARAQHAGVRPVTRRECIWTVTPGYATDGRSA